MEWQPSTPLTDEELAKLPVFPLPRVVFFPGTALPLHLFEPRYTRMMEECLDRGCTAMTVALLAPGWEDNYEGNPDIYEIAGAGRIVAHQERSDGTHDVILPHHFGKRSRAPFAGKHLITHGIKDPPAAGRLADEATLEAARTSHTPAPESTVTAAPFRA